MNCWNCKWVGEVPGSAHKCCNHPILIDELKGIILLQTVQSLFFENPTHIVLKNKETEETTDFIQVNEYGFRKGWALYPFNFDPTWINNCQGYEETPA